MKKIEVCYPELTKKIIRLYELYEELSKQLETLADLAAGLDIFWDGDANLAFMRHIGDDLVWAAAYLIRIRNLITLAHKAVDIYINGEKDVRSMVDKYLS